jgi:hypothetical protein
MIMTVSAYLPAGERAAMLGSPCRTNTLSFRCALVACVLASLPEALVAPGYP